MAKVFISYSKVDHALAKALADFIKANGISVWWDFELYAGQDFPEAIAAAIDASKAVIVIWSETAAKSPWVRSEANRALKQSKLITTHVPGFNAHLLPMPYDQFQCYDASDRARLLSALAEHDVKPQQAGPVDDSWLLAGLTNPKKRAPTLPSVGALEGEPQRLEAKSTDEVELLQHLMTEKLDVLKPSLIALPAGQEIYKALAHRIETLPQVFNVSAAPLMHLFLGRTLQETKTYLSSIEEASPSWNPRNLRGEIAIVDHMIADLDAWARM